MNKNYYKILNVNKNATNDEIKQAYKKLALKYHPDKNRNNKESSEEIFKNISEAYQILGNEENRKKYDSLYNLNKTIELTEDDLKQFGLLKKPSEVFSDVFNIIPDEYKPISKNIISYFFEDEKEFNNDLNNFEFSKIINKIKKGFADIPRRTIYRNQYSYKEIFYKMIKIVFYIFYFCAFYFYEQFQNFLQ